MLVYDPTVLQQLATSLDKRAKSLIFSRTLLGVLVGAVTALIVCKVSSGGQDIMGPVVGGGAFLGGLLGNASARAQAFALRVQAQTIMCQVAIAWNTGAAVEQLTQLVQVCTPRE